MNEAYVRAYKKTLLHAVESESSGDYNPNPNSNPNPNPNRRRPFQAGRVLVSEVMREVGPPHDDAQMQETVETAPPGGEQAGEPAGCAGPPKTRKQRRR